MPVRNNILSTRYHRLTMYYDKADIIVNITEAKTMRLCLQSILVHCSQESSVWIIQNATNIRL